MLGDALRATAKKRETEKYLGNAIELFDDVQNDSNMLKLWTSYQKKFSYAEDISWKSVIDAVKELYDMCRR